MSVLNQISSGVAQIGQRIIISGVEKIGKTTLACSAPKPLLVPLETGYASMIVDKVPLLDSFEGVMQMLEDITKAAQAGQFPYKSLVFDSVTALERLIHDATLRTDPAYAKKNAKALTMEAALGGYGKAYQYANELFGRFLSACDLLAIHGKINIVLTCHVFASNVIDPAYGEYSSWDLLVHSPRNQKTFGKREMITQWADAILFLHEPIFVSKGEGSSLSQGISQNVGRQLATERSPAWVAGNRWGVTGLIPIPAKEGWNHLAEEVHKASGIDIYDRK